MAQVARRGNFVRWDGDKRVDDPIDEWEGDWQGTAARDMTGRDIKPGMWLVKTYQSGRSCNLEIRQVREVRTVTSKDWRGNKVVSEPRVFLDTSKVPVQYPGRCLIVDWDPDLEAIRNRSGGVV